MIERIKKLYKKNTPIFIDEFYDIYSDYSKARIYQMINESLKKEELIRFDNGVYYFPKKTEIGLSKLNVRNVIQKKYISDSNMIYGFYAGLYLLNGIGITTQVPNTIEIYTNKESTRARKIKIGNQNFILKKARVEINSKNYKTLQLLELLNLLNENEINKYKNLICEYIKSSKIKRSDIIEYSKFYPAKTIKNYILSEGENVFTRK